MAEATRSNTNKPRLTTREIVVFAMLGTLMFLSKQLMEWAPNIHFLGMFTMTYTVAYRWKALIPIYLFVLLEGLYMGFALWWVPYLYLWTVLWGVTMLLPRSLPKKWAVPLYAAVCALHGLCYGTLYAPFQALAFHLSWQGTLTWIAAGLPWDAVHAAGNAAAGLLIWPIAELLKKLDRMAGKK